MYTARSPDYADANVFMRPFEIYRAALYNVYGGSRVTDVPYIIIIIYGLRAFISSMWGSLRLAPINNSFFMASYPTRLYGHDKIELLCQNDLNFA